MSRPVVLLCAEQFRDTMMDLASDLDVDVSWVDLDQDVDAVAAQCREARSIIVLPSTLTAKFARQCPNLRLVQVVSAGTDRIEIAALGEMGVRVANNGGGNAVAVSEHTIALIVGVYRKLHLQLQSARAGQWASDIRAKWSNQAHELPGRTVGIIGCGRIGSRVAQRLMGWECKIIYHDIVPLKLGSEKKLNIERVPLDDLLRASDVVTLHVPLTGQTTAMISDREFDMMKSDAILINACRGPVVDEAALIRALNGGKIAGAGLDVLEQEPTPVDNPLLNMDNVLVTPHLAALAEESSYKSRAFALENAARVAGGGEPESVVPPM